MTKYQLLAYFDKYKTKYETVYGYSFSNSLYSKILYKIKNDENFDQEIKTLENTIKYFNNSKIDYGLTNILNMFMTLILNINNCVSFKITANEIKELNDNI